jgi:hypothetical protein
VAYTMMKKLLPLALIAVACEAMAQDAQCVRERAAMVENIQAYARSDLSLSGPHGISESVLEAVRQTERHRFIPERSCSVAYMDGPVPIDRGPDNISAVGQIISHHATGIGPTDQYRTLEPSRVHHGLYLRPTAPLNSPASITLTRVRRLIRASSGRTCAIYP